VVDPGSQDGLASTPFSYSGAVEIRHSAKLGSVLQRFPRSLALP
jgi:hypothetical protein